MSGIAKDDDDLTPQEKRLLAMELASLEELRRIVDRMVSRKRAIIRHEQLAAERELLEARREARAAKGEPRTGAEREVRYRDPENPSNTWSGQGRRPNWLRERLEDGAVLGEFEV
jgi:DNA-binding protein H-NS